MTREVKIVWQHPGQEPFASVLWDDQDPGLAIIMAGRSAQNYKYKVLPVHENPIPGSPPNGGISVWAMYLTNTFGPKVRALLEEVRRADD